MKPTIPGLIALAVVSVTFVLSKPHAYRSAAAAAGSTVIQGQSSTAPGIGRNRCGVRDLDAATAAQLETSLDRFRANRNPGQIRQSGEILVPVAYHVISAGPAC
jgi:hypothetical protein